MSPADSSGESASAGDASKETKIILAVVCLLAIVAIGAEVWFHYSRQVAMEKADALRAQLTTQVPVKSAETDQALLQPIDAEPVDAAMVPAVTTQQSATEIRNQPPKTEENAGRSDTRKVVVAPRSIFDKPVVDKPRSITQTVATKQPVQTRINQNPKVAKNQNRTTSAKAIPDQDTATPAPVTITPEPEEDSASGLPPVVDRTVVVANARTGGVKRQQADENVARSARSVWEQLREDIKTKGGKADFCHDAARSLNQCP